MPRPDRFLMLPEALAVLKDLKRRAKRSRSKHLDLIVFRLACCVGLRRKEIAGLVLSDLVLSGPRPCITVRANNTKGRDGCRRSRTAPLWWDAGTAG